MSIGSRLKIESIGIFLTAVFYTVAGTGFLSILALADFRLLHIGILGVTSLVTAYGLFRKRNWAIYPVVMLFFIATTFALYMLFYLFVQDLIVGIAMISYLILTWVATVYTAVRRTVLS
jgi:hypothetical protein